MPQKKILVIGVFLLAALIVALLPTEALYAQFNQLSEDIDPFYPLELPTETFRDTISLNGEWQFKSNVDDQWTSIDVPGCYAIQYEGYWANYFWDVFHYPKRWADNGAIYRRTFTLPAAMQGQRISLNCGGSFHQTSIFLDNVHVGEHSDGYLAFQLPLEIDDVAEHTLELKISGSNTFPMGIESDAARGIWQDIFLESTPDVFVEHPVRITTSVANATIQCDVPIHNANATATSLWVRQFVVNQSGNIELIFDGGNVQLSPQQTFHVVAGALWETPHIWWPYDPYLYKLYTVLYDAKAHPVDCYVQSFGFREISMDDSHLYLNGSELYLRAERSHYFGDLQGTKGFARNYISSLKSLGINFLWLRQPLHKAWYEAADELGMLLGSTVAFPASDSVVTKTHAEKLIQQLTPHPSIIVWDATINTPANKFDLSEGLINYVRSLDSTRLVVSENAQELSDIIMYAAGQVSADMWDSMEIEKPIFVNTSKFHESATEPLTHSEVGADVTAQDYAAITLKNPYVLTDQNILGMEVTYGNTKRVNGVIVPEFSYNLFRWQPFNYNRGIIIPSDTLNLAGVQPKHIASVASTLNIWDVELPLLEPNPAFYTFGDRLQPVIFMEADTLCTFFGGDHIVRTGKLIYNDLPEIHELHCLVEKQNGEALWENRQLYYLLPGEIVDHLELEYLLPEVTYVTPVNLVLEFYSENQMTYRHVTPVKLFPRFYPLPGIDQTFIGVHDSLGRIQQLLTDQKINFRNVPKLATLDTQKVDILLTGAIANIQSNSYLAPFLARGGRVVSFTAGFSGTEIESNRQGALCVIGELTRFTSVPEHLVNQTYILANQWDYDWGTLPYNDQQADFMHFKVNKSVTVYVAYDWQASAIPPWLNNWTRETDKLYTSDPNVTYRLFSRQFPAGEIVLGENISRDVRQMYTVIVVDANPDSTVKLDVRDVYVRSGELCRVVPNGMRGASDQAPIAARLLMNGARHNLIRGLNQQDFTYWRNGAIAHALLQPDGMFNSRMIVAADKDGNGSAMQEYIIGDGLAIVTSLKILNSYFDEPVASYLFRNLLDYTIRYKPSAKRAAAVFAGSEFNQLLEQVGLQKENLSANTVLQLNNVACLILDASDSGITKGLQAPAFREAVNAYIMNGGHVFIWNINDATLPWVNFLLNDSLQLTEPYLNERSHCVKAAISWTRRDTPDDLIAYTDRLLIPQPFEPNYDPLLTGISNGDLYWDGAPMFTNGIERKGMNPVRYSEDHSILVSNWRNDWNAPKYGGDFVYETMDKRRANWFINRDPVILKINRGQGSIVICQLALNTGSEKGIRLLRHLLTGMGCAIGQPTAFATDEFTWDFSQVQNQHYRFTQSEGIWPNVQRTLYGDQIDLEAKDQNPKSSGNLPRMLVIGDSTVLHYASFLKQACSGTFNVTVADPFETLPDAVYTIDRVVNGQKYNSIFIHFNSINCFPMTIDQKSIAIDEMQRQFTELASLLQKNGAIVYFSSIIPYTDSSQIYDIRQIKKLNDSLQKEMKRLGVLVIDPNINIQKLPSGIPATASINLNIGYWKKLAGLYASEMSNGMK
ncbi:hypothetical protein JW960_00825 [candidate division KSB1 bacterium]|nr:hypothetical protein [candidate division KSB1 bacterium]